MSKKVVTLTLSSALAFSLFNSIPFHEQAQAQSVHSVKSEHSVHLHLNPEATDAFLQNERFQKGNEKYLGHALYKAKKDHGQLKLDFTLSSFETLGEAHITGTGKIHINQNGKPVDLQFDETIQEIDLGHKKVYFGGIRSQSNTQAGAASSVIGLYFDPATNDAVASVTIGEIDFEKGNAVATFGDITEDYKKAREIVLDMGKAKAAQTDKSLTASIQEKLFGSRKAYASMTSTPSTQFNYKTYAQTSQLSENSYPWTTGTYGTASSTVYGINVYARDRYLAGNGQGMAWVRGWTNTSVVANYLKSTDPYAGSTFDAGLSDVYIGLGNTNLLINIDNNLTWPKDTDDIQAWEVPIGGIYAEVANVVFNLYAKYQNYSKPISTVNKKYSTVMSSWIAYEEKKIRSLDKLANLPSGGSVYGSRGSGGGISVKFYFNEQVDGTQQLFAKSQAVYLAGTNITPALTYFTTPQVVASYYHNF